MAHESETRAVEGTTSIEALPLGRLAWEEPAKRVVLALSVVFSFGLSFLVIWLTGLIARALASTPSEALHRVSPVLDWIGVVAGLITLGLCLVADVRLAVALLWKGGSGDT
jgi:hypothetical protein